MQWTGPKLTLEVSIVCFRDIRMTRLSWEATSSEPFYKPACTFQRVNLQKPCNTKYSSVTDDKWGWYKLCFVYKKHNYNVMGWYAPPKQNKTHTHNPSKLTKQTKQVFGWKLVLIKCKETTFSLSSVINLLVHFKAFRIFLIKTWFLTILVHETSKLETVYKHEACWWQPYDIVYIVPWFHHQQLLIILSCWFRLLSLSLFRNFF